MRVGFSYRTPLDEETPWDVSATRAAGLHDLADVAADYRGEVTTTRARLMRGGACDADAAEADVRLEVEALEAFAYPADLSSPADADPALFLAAPGCALLRWTVAGEALAPYLGVAAHVLVARLDLAASAFGYAGEPPYTFHFHGATPENVERDSACAANHLDFASDAAASDLGHVVVGSALFPEPGVYLVAAFMAADGGWTALPATHAVFVGGYCAGAASPAPATCAGAWRAAAPSCAAGGTDGPTVVPGTPSAAPVFAPTRGARASASAADDDAAAANTFVVLVVFLPCMVLVMLLLYLKVTRTAPRAPDPAAEELRAPPSPGAAPPPPPAWISAPPKERASEIELPLANGTDPNVSTLI